MKIIFDYNRTIFDPETGALYPGVLGLLKILEKKNELFLISRNEPERRAVMDRLNISRFFKKIEFSDEKSPESFKAIIGNDKKVIVVGDSIKSEISVGNALGLITVRILQGKFASEMPESSIQKAQYEIRDIGEIMKIIELYEN